MKNSVCLFFLILLSTAGTSQAQTQKRWYPGFTAGWQVSSFQQRNEGYIIDNSASFRAAFLLDYEITRRLSLSTQLGVQHMNATPLFGDNSRKLTYPEIWLGLNEYLPVGGGSLFINLSTHAGYGFPSGNTNVFSDASYKRFRIGWGALFGYVFRNGFFINTGLQSSFTNYIDGGSAFPIYESSAHAISLGFMFRTKERNKARQK